MPADVGTTPRDRLDFEDRFRSAWDLQTRFCGETSVYVLLDDPIVVELAFSKWVIEAIGKSFCRIVLTEQAIKEEREIPGIEIDERDADNRSLSGLSVCISELDAL